MIISEPTPRDSALREYVKSQDNTWSFETNDAFYAGWDAAIVALIKSELTEEFDNQIDLIVQLLSRKT